MRCPVLFQDALELAIDEGFDVFVELGAHPALAGPVRSCLAHKGRDGTVVGSLHREEGDHDAMAKALAELHVAGVDAALERVVSEHWNFVELPGQRFEKS